MIILGRSGDDKGKQLEQLTRRLVEDLGYRNVVVNKVDVGGEEIDVAAEFPLPQPGSPTTHRLICECKAHKAPTDMTDWLKFLGKVYVEESLSGQEVFGCFIALSGVNGNVHGGYDKLRLRRRNVQLVSGATLVDHLRRTHGLADFKAIAERLGRLSERQQREIDVAYYEGRTYWLVLYEDNRYTLLGPGGEPLPRAEVDAVAPLVGATSTGQVYVDLLEEAKAKKRSVLAQKAVVAGLMIGSGKSRPEELTAFQKEVTSEEWDSAVAALAGLSWLVRTGEGDQIAFAPETDASYGRLADVYRFLLQDVVFLRPLGCPWYDGHISEGLVGEACRIQENLVLSPDEVREALRLMRWLPGALLYALTPDPMIVTHRRAEPPTEQLTAADRKHFLRSLYREFVRDFESGQFAEYFYRVRGLREVDRTQVIVVKSAEAAVHEGAIRQRMIVGEVGEVHGGGYLMVLGDEAGPEPWEWPKGNGTPAAGQAGVPDGVAPTKKVGGTPLSSARKRRPTPWTMDEFLNEAVRHGGRDLAALHHDLLTALQESPPLEVRFDGRGPAEASYNVYAPGVRKELLRVRATGKFQACVGHLAEAGQPERAAFYREQLGTWIPEDGGGWPWLAKTLPDIDIDHLARSLKSVAEHTPGPAM